MMTFSEHNQTTKTLLLYYANKLNNQLAKEIVNGQSNLRHKEDAEAIAYFFWEMTDLAAEDEDNDRVIEGVSDLQFWLEKSLYLFRGYFKNLGYEKEWSEGYDKYHSE